MGIHQTSKRVIRSFQYSLNSCVQRVFDIEQHIVSSGYRWAVSATSPDAFEANLLTAGIPDREPIQMLQTCLILAAVRGRVLSKPHAAGRLGINTHSMSRLS